MDSRQLKMTDVTSRYRRRTQHCTNSATVSTVG